MPMLCGFAITSRLEDPILLLTRKDQQKLTDWLRNELGEAPLYLTRIKDCTSFRKGVLLSSFSDSTESLFNAIHFHSLSIVQLFR